MRERERGERERGVRGVENNEGETEKEPTDRQSREGVGRRERMKKERDTWMWPGPRQNKNNLRKTKKE